MKNMESQNQLIACRNVNGLINVLKVELKIKENMRKNCTKPVECCKQQQDAILQYPHLMKPLMR